MRTGFAMHAHRRFPFGYVSTEKKIYFVWNIFGYLGYSVVEGSSWGTGCWGLPVVHCPWSFACPVIDPEAQTRREPVEGSLVVCPREQLNLCESVLIGGRAKVFGV
jgi:hypothetical protein